MKSLNFIATLLALLLTSAAFSPALADPDDPLPWPWGTECPFPWNNIEGMWSSKDGDLKNQFQFRITSIWDNGTHIFEINRYSEDGQLVGRGQGIAPAGQRIVRALMFSIVEDGFLGERYNVIVRAYRENENITCDGDLVTVLTIRPLDGKEKEDSHYIINKME